MKVAYEKDKIRYNLPKNYIPDFTIDLPNGHTIYIEMKGWYRYEDQVKMKYVKETNPDLDIRMVFPQNNLIGKHMRYSDWCEKYGFPYHIGPLVPVGWYN